MHNMNTHVHVNTRTLSDTHSTHKLHNTSMLAHTCTLADTHTRHSQTHTHEHTHTHTYTYTHTDISLDINKTYTKTHTHTHNNTSLSSKISQNHMTDLAVHDIRSLVWACTCTSCTQELIHTNQLTIWMPLETTTQFTSINRWQHARWSETTKTRELADQDSIFTLHKITSLLHNKHTVSTILIHTNTMEPL